MKQFTDILKAIGLDPTQTGTVVRGGAKNNIIYEAVADSATSNNPVGLCIHVGHKFQGLLTKGSWDDDPGGGITLSCARAVARAGSYRYGVACQWSLVVQAVTSDGVDMVFGHDSDVVTTWLVKMTTVMMKDFRDYLE
ncbi:hypothetical protein [Desulfocurvus sp. DL9XJH121]